MGFVDYIFINFYTYYSKGSYKLKWSTPQSYSIYAMTLAIVVWSLVIQFLVVHFILHTSFLNFYIIIYSSKILASALIAIFLAAGFYYFFYRRYVQSNYYSQLANNYEKNDDQKKSRGIFITFLIAYIIPAISVCVFAFLPKP
jgi:hypothetical protein